MWTFTFAVVALSALANGQQFQAASPRSGDELVSSVLENCAEMTCVKQNVLGYLDNMLNIQSDRNVKNLDSAIYKRAARVLKTHEFRLRVPQVLLENTDIVYNPITGLDVDTHEEARALGLKKKLLLPFLLLFKLKTKILMPIFVALIGLKATKALILSKLAILMVIGFIAYQFMGKSGMPMPMMSMTPAEHPTPLYGPPSGPPSGPSTPSSYEPSWEPNHGGPYQRVWTGSNDAQSMAYSAYYPGSSSTSHP